MIEPNKIIRGDCVKILSNVSDPFADHPCQMPEAVLERIVNVSSNPGDLVLDPFSGSGTTMVVAAQLEREYFGLDISEDCVANAVQQIEDTLAGKRKTTEISENPIEKRAGRKVGGKRETTKKTATDTQTPALF